MFTRMRLMTSAAATGLKRGVGISGVILRCAMLMALQAQLRLGLTHQLGAAAAVGSMAGAAFTLQQWRVHRGHHQVPACIRVTLNT